MEQQKLTAQDLDTSSQVSTEPDVIRRQSSSSSDVGSARRDGALSPPPHNTNNNNDSDIGTIRFETGNANDMGVITYTVTPDGRNYELETSDGHSIHLEFNKKHAYLIVD